MNATAVREPGRWNEQSAFRNPQSKCQSAMDLPYIALLAAIVIGISSGRQQKSWQNAQRDGKKNCCSEATVPPGHRLL
jgi:hypothetical protein